MELEQDRKLWPGFLHMRPKPWLGPAGLGLTEGERSWQSRAFACGVPGEKGLILTQLAAGIRLLSGTGTPQAVLPGRAEPDTGQSGDFACEGTLWDRVHGV